MANHDENEKEDKTVIVTKVAAPEKTPKIAPYLIQLSGKETGQQVCLSNRNIKIGRDPVCELSLDDPHISRQHAEISWENGRAVMRDLGSTNGIVVNGQRIKEHVLEEGDKILVGTRLYFKYAVLDSHEQTYQQTLFNAANIDALTGLYSRKFFQDILSKEFSFSKRNRTPLSLLILDIDFFKKINDTYGHPGGDEVLRKVGAIFKNVLRFENLSCRYGGEEFAIILRNTNPGMALQVAERLRKTIETEEFQYKDSRIPVTISIGIATLENENYETTDDLVLAADESLYEAKQTGRNRVVTKKAA